MSPSSSGASPTPVAFPHQDEIARRFFREAVRHLEDARVLHQSERYAGAVASVQKAVELGIKAALMLDGALGWWDRLQQTHRPFEEIQAHPVLGHHRQRILAQNPALGGQIEAIEQLAPSKPDLKEFKLELQANAEYPFFYLLKASGNITAHLENPGDYFTETESLEHYQAARELLATYQAIYALVNSWALQLPPQL